MRQMARSIEKLAKARDVRRPQRCGVGSGWIGPGSGAIALAVFLAFSGVACSGPSGRGDGRASDDPIGSTSEAIYGGVIDSDATQNSSVVALKIGDGAQTFKLCTAAIIAPNIVLTARHCVSANLTDTVGCNASGLSTNGAQLGDDVDATTLHVFLGASPDLQNALPAANGKAIFHSTSDVLCNQDLAIVVLDKSLTNVTPLAVRLSTKTAAGEKVRSVGYGLSDTTNPVGTRLRKDNVAILAVGSQTSANNTPLATNEMEVGESICEGDSGGPAISEKTGAIVGVVSRGGSCTDDHGHIYTLVRGFQSVLTQAFATVGGTPVPEPEIAASVDAGASNGGTSNNVDAGSSATSDNGADGDDAGSTNHASTVNLHTGANASACSARIAGGETDQSAGWLASFGALALVKMKRRKRR